MAVAEILPPPAAAVPPVPEVEEATVLMRGRLRGGECRRVDEVVPGRRVRERRECRLVE